MTATPLLTLRDVRFRYPGAPADAVTVERLDVAPGERLFLRGASGSGKTTLLSLLAGILVADAGSVTLAGQDWRRLAPARRDRLRADAIGYVFQQFNLLPYLPAIENVRLGCAFSAGRAARAGASPAATARRLLAAMGIEAALADRRAAALSVGQQQRVAAARALIGGPSLVLADEPTSALDEATRASFMDVLLDACAAAGSALVFVSHDERLADRFDRALDLGALRPAEDRATEASR